MSTEITIAKKLNGTVLQVLGNKAVEGFEKAYVISTAVVELRKLLTSEYMKSIMAMQGTRLGFVTDRDKNGGYPEAVVKECLIEAVLLGLQPYGNQFNIIAGKMYVTKEGCGALLERIEGLNYNIVCEIKTVNQEKTSAIIEALITWNSRGSKAKTKTIPIPIKMDQYASVDSLIGKSTRKARAWLLSNLTGMEIPEGDSGETITIKPTVQEKKEKVGQQNIDLP